jgi:AcrR family transcriptional regulator
MKTVKSKRTPPRRGRPRSFNANRALDRALDVFWRKGYEGASLSELTKAMGINRPSLYAAFGDKEGLFRKALDRYPEGPASYCREAMSQPTARAMVKHLLEGAAGALTDPQHPRGCLYVQGALACGKESEPIQRELISRRLANEAVVCERLKRAQAEGELARDASPSDLARFVATVLQGMAVQAAGGATRAELERVVQTALRAWPK